MYNMYQNPLPSSNTLCDESSQLMTPLELASYLGIGRNLAYELLKDGIIKGFKIGKQWRVSKQAVDTYIAKRSHLI